MDQPTNNAANNPPHRTVRHRVFPDNGGDQGAQGPASNGENGLDVYVYFRHPCFCHAVNEPEFTANTVACRQCGDILIRELPGANYRCVRCGRHLVRFKQNVHGEVSMVDGHDSFNCQLSEFGCAMQAMIEELRLLQNQLAFLSMHYNGRRENE